MVIGSMAVNIVNGISVKNIGQNLMLMNLIGRSQNSEEPQEILESKNPLKRVFV